MISGKTLRWPAVAVVTALGCFLAGCGGGGGDSKNPTQEHISQMFNLFNAYKTANNGKPPVNPQALKEWAQKQPKDKLDQWIKDPLDSVFTSPRDGEPYAIAPPPQGRAGMGPQRVVIYEKVGVGGKRMIASGMATVQEMGEEEFKSIVPSP